MTTMRTELINSIIFIFYQNDYSTMDYIVILPKDKNETTLILSLFKKMKVKASRLSASQIEDTALLHVMQESEKSGKGNLKNVLSHLDKVIAGK